VNVVSGGNELGAWMTAHKAVRKISFTGSVATGHRIAAAAAEDLKRVTLELGGNDPAIVLEDADPKAIAKKLFWSAFNNCGQVCIAIKRLYIAEALYEPLLAELVAVARSARVGDGLKEETQIGPLNNAPQLERVMELVRDARAHGAKIAAGGERIGTTGYFHQPTILTDVNDSMRIVAEEQFGPALPVMSFKTVDEVIARANNSHFGLGGSVWTSNRERGIEIAAQLESGTGWVNTHGALTPLAPFGGSKESGIGYELGRWGIDGFTQLQVINAVP
jgi:acyl-CoA reductase-like NAD-dependent aldehyde dehydrogenase